MYTSASDWASMDSLMEIKPQIYKTSTEYEIHFIIYIREIS